MLPKLFSPTVQHRTGDAESLADGFLRGITLHAFEHYFQFAFWRITHALRVRESEYLSLLMSVISGTRQLTPDQQNRE
jgi:hypothetical protein